MDVLDSPLRHQTRAVRCFPDGTGFALGSVEGRVAMEFWDEGHDAARYAFKCHRGPAADGSGDTIYPVHALAFHEPYGTFASGGGDGCVAAWDGQRKKRLALWQGYPTSIAALAFNKTGTLLAVASSYAFEQGECSHPPDAIYIRSVTDADVKPRPKCVGDYSWEDGAKTHCVRTAPDRWAVHTADLVNVTLDDLKMTVVQKPHSIPARKIGVGACLWDGALVLGGYLCTLPPHRLVGARCIELGAGVGFAGLVAALRGAQTVLTDIERVLPLLRENVGANGFPPEARPALGEPSARVEELEWGSEGWLDRLPALREPPLDWVLAADCCYVDRDGASPSTPAFVQTCWELASEKTVVLVAFERRSEEVCRTFEKEARAAFRLCEKVPLAQYSDALRIEYVDIWRLQK
ncbi:hypothetical protein H632_c543p1 [Helicosporidium sp. ATCC 50920]|nr:hypothetical protein H632_c543p1 [Helicosporidium sp. ATCC 50920]|eukprot:KDD75700.1 hypothetical protein H632_c543p1 [Helicosporidium sp. ATCC 50920]